MIQIQINNQKEDENYVLSPCSCCGRSFGIEKICFSAIKFACFGEKLEEPCQYVKVISNGKKDYEIQQGDHCQTDRCKLTKIKNFDKIQKELVEKSIQIIDQILKKQRKLIFLLENIYQVEQLTFKHILEHREKYSVYTQKIDDNQYIIIYPQ